MSGADGEGISSISIADGSGAFMRALERPIFSCRIRSPRSGTAHRPYPCHEETESTFIQWRSVYSLSVSGSEELLHR